MRKSLLPRAQIRRASAAAAAGAIGAALLPALIFTNGPASATTPCVPTGYSATSSADLLHLTALDVQPLGLLPAPIADVTIGHATADMAHGHQGAAFADATYLSATLAGIRVPNSLLNAHAHQAAPPSNPTPDSRSLVSLQSGVLSFGAGKVSASAGQSGSYSCGLATGRASIADVVAAPNGSHSLLALPTNLNGKAAAGLTTVGGHLGSEGGAGVGLADVELFGGTTAAIGIRVITEPALFAIAGGTAATSSVAYTAPVLDVTLPGGKHETLDSAHATVSFGASINPTSIADPTSLVGALTLKKVQVQVRLSLGRLTKSVTPTSVSASATTLRLEVVQAPLGAAVGLLANLTTGGHTVLDLGIGRLNAAATAPATTDTTVGTGSACSDGYGCTTPSPCSGYGYCKSPSPKPSTSPTPGHAPSPTPSTSVAGTTTKSLPLTGSSTPLFVGAGVILVLLGRLLMLVARRRAEA